MEEINHKEHEEDAEGHKVIMNKTIKDYLILVIKGMGMGAANVVPGVSGGTIALITGIFQKLINSIKAFDLTALKYLLTGKFKKLAQHINLDFLIAVFAGVAVSIITIAKLFGFLMDHYPVYLWSFFFGLILASIYFVGKTIDNWNLSTIICLVIGTAIAGSFMVLKPASENDSVIYLFLCGIIAACSMILPGLSGSFVLILLGNYRLVMIDAVNNLDFMILIPVVIGAGVGLIAFSHFLAWIFKKYKNQTIALLSGFILGSLGLLWPWKNEIYLKDELGNLIVKKGENVLEGYEWVLPQHFNTEVILAIVFIVIGIITIWATEYLATKQENN